MSNLKIKLENHSQQMACCELLDQTAIEQLIFLSKRRRIIKYIYSIYVFLNVYNVFGRFLHDERVGEALARLTHHGRDAEDNQMTIPLISLIIF